ncbi:MAG: CoA pyrophosphatase [Solirubrobacterales bacterium]|nr:CoA pyrophosphatase [Solirubrobacterales bacterium]
MEKRPDFDSLDLGAALIDGREAAGMKTHGRLEAAVLIPVAGWPERPAITFTERRDDLRHHAGEISFPGGVREPADRDLSATALRESMEEISLAAERVEVVGALPPVGTFVTSFRVQPFVGLVSGDDPLVANPDEVAAILNFGVDDLVEAYGMRRLVRRGVPIRTPTFQMDRHLIWGATARILTEFLNRIGALR